MIGAVLAICGLIFLWSRFRERTPRLEEQPATSGPLVSIVVPARNEERVLGRLLKSLSRLHYVNREIIVVDDESSDGTAAIAEEHGATLVRGKPAPDGIRGKQWACQQGADVAKGEYLLFTDADTWHDENSLGRIVAFMEKSRADMGSCLPYHQGREIWERGMGAFHALLIAVTAPFELARPKRVFAIGQYLIFRRPAYDEMGGHRAVGNEIVEDIPLARLAVRKHLKYRVYTSRTLFSVRMYESLTDFIAGWRRNFRAGLSGATAWAPFEVTCMIAALTGAGMFFSSALTTWSMILALALIARAGTRLGNFNFWSVLMAPFAVGMFVYITLLAVYDSLTGQGLHWKGRVYR